MKKFALFAGFVALACATSAVAAPAKKAPAPAAARDWSKTVTKTVEGGYRMGNPAARVKVIEYGSMTCSHCAHFDETGYAPLVQNYVRTGKVAFEFRNFVRDPYDMAAAITARCAGPARFFPFTNALFKTREAWITKAQGGQDRLKPYEGKGPTAFLPVVGSVAGFDTFAAGRGVAPATLKACLSSQAQIDELMAIRNAATMVEGTPTFLVNGNKATLTVDRELWPQVEDAIKAALAR